MLAIAGVHAFYGSIEALKGVDLTIAKEEIVALIGANGAGKSTLLMTICGRPRAAAGRITFDERDITEAETHEIVRLGISHAPEGRRIFPRMTVLENLELGAFARADRQNVPADLGKIFALFPRLKERQHQKGGTLSGGEQQMLAMGRALMARPRLLLLDEPSMGLSPIMVQTIFETIGNIREQGMTILLVEQNARMALRIANRGYVIQAGHITIHDSAEGLLRSDVVRKSYLGEKSA